MVVVDFMLSQEKTVEAAWVDVHLFNRLILENILV